MPDIPENKTLHTSDDALERLLSDFLSRAISSQSGTSAKNIAQQIQSSVPFQDILQKIKEEIDQSTTAIADELAQQTLAQQVINNFGASALAPTQTRSTTEKTNTTDEVETTTALQEQEEMGADNTESNKPTSDTPTEPTPEEEPNTPSTQTNLNQPEEPSTDEPSKPSIDEETDASDQDQDNNNTQTDEPNTDKQNKVFGTQDNSQASGQPEQERNQYAQGILSDEKKAAIANKANELGQRTGKQIYQDMKECRFKGFILAIIIAIFIDALDLILQLITVGTIGTVIMDFIIKPFAYGALWFILLQQGNFVTRLLRKQVTKRLIAPLILELLPFISILPVSTILIIWLQYTLYQERKKLGHELSLWEKYNKTTKQAKKTLDKRSKARWDNIQHTLANAEQNAV